jgi:regulator of replication initiation timing
MDSLDARQREMRERRTRERSKKSKREDALPPFETAATDANPDVRRLKKRIAELQEQVSALQLENNRMRQQKTTVVERSGGDSVKEQQHNFFKYSNTRRY